MTNSRGLPNVAASQKGEHRSTGAQNREFPRLAPSTGEFLFTERCFAHELERTASLSLWARSSSWPRRSNLRCVRRQGDAPGGHRASPYLCKRAFLHTRESASLSAMGVRLLRGVIGLPSFCADPAGPAFRATRTFRTRRESRRGQARTSGGSTASRCEQTRDGCQLGQIAEAERAEARVRDAAVARRGDVSGRPDVQNPGFGYVGRSSAGAAPTGSSDGTDALAAVRPPCQRFRIAWKGEAAVPAQASCSLPAER